MSLARKIVVMGSLKVDIVTRLPVERDADPSNPDVYAVAPLTIRVGGTAGTFSRAAAALFDEVAVIAAVGGGDGLAAMLDAHVAAIGGPAHLQYCPNVANGVVVSVRGVVDHGHHRRLLIASRDSAHLHLAASHIAAGAALIGAGEALVTDGYFLRSAVATDALGTAMDIANMAGVPVVFDLVPHSLPKTTTAEVLAPLLHRSSYIVTVARTLVGLCEHRWPLPEPSDEHMAERAVRYARRLANATWLIRYGTGDMSHVRRVDPNGDTLDYCTRYETTPDEDRWGFGDRLLAAELHADLQPLVEEPCRSE
jgi:sugar/nucleoside kinase (ribokinase family)